MRPSLIATIAGVFLALTSTSAYAGIYWDDGFEAGNTGYALVAGMAYDTTIVHSGSRSLREDFLGGHIQGGTFSDRTFPYTQDLYTRFWMYLPGSFQVDAQAQTKMMLTGQDGVAPSYWWVMPFGSASLTVAVQGTNAGNETTNYYGPGIPRDRWVCVETHIRNNTPGVPNGIIESWINGVQGHNLTNINMRDNSGGNNSPTAGFTLLRQYVQYGGPGPLYYDDIAVGDQRIGCSGGGGPVGDTTPPAVPSGLTAR